MIPAVSSGLLVRSRNPYLDHLEQRAEAVPQQFGLSIRLARAPRAESSTQIDTMVFLSAPKDAAKRRGTVPSWTRRLAQQLANAQQPLFMSSGPTWGHAPGFSEFNGVLEQLLSHSVIGYSSTSNQGSSAGRMANRMPHALQLKGA